MANGYTDKPIEQPIQMLRHLALQNRTYISGCLGGSRMVNHVHKRVQYRCTTEEVTWQRIRTASKHNIETLSKLGLIRLR
jgi:hypothetical protein